MYSVCYERDFFFAPFGIYLHEWVFQKLQLHLSFGQKKNRANKFQIKLEFVFITYKYFIATINLL